MRRAWPEPAQDNPLALRSLTGTALARSASASVHRTHLHRTPRTCGSGQVCGAPQVQVCGPGQVCP
jgi:hypothetical protein